MSTSGINNQIIKAFATLNRLILKEILLFLSQGRLESGKNREEGIEKIAGEMFRVLKPSCLSCGTTIT
jgi:hypothetical protein